MSKSESKTQVSANDFSQNSVNKNIDKAKDAATIPRHQKLSAIRSSLIKIVNEIKIQRVVLGVILCTITIGISVPFGVFAIRSLNEGVNSTVRLPVYQNYCKIHSSSMVS